jgi:tripartite-type tricarboxylate transporter receptor subunit TctC
MNTPQASRARRQTLLTALLAIIAFTPAAAGAQDYPSRPISVVVPYPAGSFTDNVMRPIAIALTKSLGQSVVIDNRAGAQGVVGTQFGARARPDGYTLLVGSSTSLAANVGLFKSLPYDPLKDFQPVAGLAYTSMMFMVRPNSPAKDLPSFLALARKEASPMPAGIGSSSAQVGLALLSRVSGVKFTPISYKGTPQVITDLIGGVVPMGVVDVGNGVPHIKSGRLVPLAISGTSRSVSAPEVPTLAETWANTQLVTWVGLVAPAGTPMAIVDKLHAAVNEALANPEIRKTFAAMATEIEPVTPQALKARMERDLVQWGELIRAAGIAPE